jgi:hypothetical protein
MAADVFCAYPRCKRLAAIIYLERPLCDACWSSQCDRGDGNFLRQKLKLPLHPIWIPRGLKQCDRLRLEELAAGVGLPFPASWDDRSLRCALRLMRETLKTRRGDGV